MGEKPQNIMKRILLTLLTVGLLSLNTYAGDLWKVENGSYISSDLNSLVVLYNTKHGTNRYRAIRDYFIARGTLTPCYSGMVVEAFSYQGGVATIIGSNGSIGYIPQEDFIGYLGNRQTEPAQVSQYSAE